MNDDLTLKFGKYRGRKLWTVPSGYLKWMAENHKNDRLATAADEEWRFREKHGTHWKFEED